MKTRSQLALSAIVLLLATGAAAQAREGGPGGAMFERFDTDGNGEITRAEIEAHQAEMFKAADTNGDGLLSEDELRAAAEQRRDQRFARMIEAMDENGDGLLSPDEMADGREGMIFQQLDADKDGVVTREEAAAAARDRGRGHGGGRPPFFRPRG